MFGPGGGGGPVRQTGLTKLVPGDFGGILDRLFDEDLETWGYPRAGIVAQLDAVTPSGAKKSRSWNRYALERRLLVRLRKNIHHNAFGRLVQRIRFVCEVLLR